jgi:glycosyltransferase involved in cell wall biosynthesis
MINNGPLVSVCVPVYNGEKYIEETLQNILNQSYKNLEIIFSDNCSTDRTIEMIKSHNDPRVKIFQNEKNMGVKYNYLQAFSYATGKYMVFVAADDGMALTTLEKCVNVLEKHNEVSYVNGYVSVINDESTPVFVKKFIFGGGIFSSYWAIRSNFLYGSNTIGESNGAMFRREQYDKIPRPIIKHSNPWTYDIELQNELLLQGKLCIIPEPLGVFRVSHQGTSIKELKFAQAKLFRNFAYALYKDKRYRLSFFWVITATVNSLLLEIARNVFYILFIKKKK